MNKNSRVFWHLEFWLIYFLDIFKKKLSKKAPYKKLAFTLNEESRISYYISLNKKFSLTSYSKISDFSRLKDSGYFYDLYKILMIFPSNLKFNCIFGDVTHTPDSPTFVKSRPISKSNQNAILLPLNSRRHLNFIFDKIKFENKHDLIVWRGAAYRETRTRFLRATYDLAFCDVGCTGSIKNNPYKKKRLPIEEQLNYKFIFSVEGNDVATNLKWIMSSNSLCFMLKPKFETWFMEGSLIPGVHYVEIKDDFSDLENQYNFYLRNPEKALEIIRNANHYVEQFLDLKTQYKIARGVVEKYAQLSSQLQ